MPILLPVLRNIVLSYCLVTVVASATPWSEALIQSLSAEDPAEAERLIETRSRDGSMASDYAEVASWIRSSGNKSHAAFLQLRLTWALEKDFDRSSYGAYTQVVRDPRVEGETRQDVLRLMLREGERLGEEYQDSLFETTLDLSENAEAPKPLRAFALAQLGSQPSLRSFKVFLHFVNGHDDELKAAAFQGLGRRILANRRAGRGAENWAIFSALRTAFAVPLEIDRVMAMASLSEDYSRAYLLERCRGDATRMAAIFHHDEELQHKGLILEALELMEKPNTGFMQNAIRHGLKDPPAMIATLKKGSIRERAAALKLQRLFLESQIAEGGR